MKKKFKLEIIIPIIVAIIIVAVFIYLDYIKEKAKVPDLPWTITTKPVHPSENPRRSEEINFVTYGCGGPGSFDPVLVKQPDKVWEIDKRGKIISLGRYRVNHPKFTVLDIPKLWLYFVSESLSKRDDKWYGLEKSYVSKIILKVNGHEREIKLGGDEYMFIELDNYPLGDYYPYEDMNLEFEFLIELKCSNLKKGIFRKSVCLDNQGKPLNYINNANIQAQIRVFAVGCQEFTEDIIVDGNFKYGK